MWEPREELWYEWKAGADFANSTGAEDDSVLASRAALRRRLEALPVAEVAGDGC
jgi:hypothetical protein